MCVCELIYYYLFLKKYFYSFLNSLLLFFLFLLRFVRILKNISSQNTSYRLYYYTVIILLYNYYIILRRDRARFNLFVNILFFIYCADIFVFHIDNYIIILYKYTHLRCENYHKHVSILSAATVL